MEVDSRTLEERSSKDLIEQEEVSNFILSISFKILKFLFFFPS